MIERWLILLWNTVAETSALKHMCSFSCVVIVMTVPSLMTPQQTLERYSFMPCVFCLSLSYSSGIISSQASYCFSCFFLGFVGAKSKQIVWICWKRRRQWHPLKLRLQIIFVIWITFGTSSWFMLSTWARQNGKQEHNSHTRNPFESEALTRTPCETRHGDLAC